MLAAVGAITLYGSANASPSTIYARGGEQFVANALVMSNFKFSPGPVRANSGDVLTWTDETGDPHTISVVSQVDLPSSIEDVFECAVCGPFLAGHFPGGFGSPPVPVLN